MLRFEVTAETYALFREAVSQLRRRSDERLDDDALLMTMARTTLHGPSDEGRSRYQVSLSVCSECGRAAQVVAGDLVPVGPEIAAMAECDAQHIGNVASAAREAPHGNGASHRMLREARVGAPTDAHVGARDAVPAPRAKQTTRPAQRRAAMQRDQRRCRVPGCCNATFVDVHHLTARADGGGDRLSNLIVLCAAHHRAAHRGELVIEGSTAESVRFFHADGSAYGAPHSAEDADVYAKVFSALCRLGFRDGEVRRALAEMRREPGAAQVTAEALLREALGRLTAGK